MKTTAGFVVEAGKARFGDHFQMKGITLNTLDLKVSSKDTDGRIAVFIQKGFTPRGGPPFHVHPNQDEMIFIAEGEYFFCVGNDDYYLKAGDTILLPRGIPHSYIQLNESGKMLVMYQPAGRMEDFFRATTEWSSVPSEEEISRLFEEHDMLVVGPSITVKYAL
ncbi:MAG: cupin domain-containing protein [Bacteroidetes bacterium]|nr:cupin domain-containing protein [Bacteroidota bacterium]